MPRGQLETDRFILQRFTRRDTTALDVAIRSSLADLNQWLPWARMDYTSGDTSAFIRGSVQAWKTRSRGARNTRVSRTVSRSSASAAGFAGLFIGPFLS